MIRVFLLSILIQHFAINSYAQTDISIDTIILKIETENLKVVQAECFEGKSLNKSKNKQEGKIITNRALNLFFANKIASFLTEGGDISLFGSYATLGTDDGRLSVNQNFGTGKKKEGRIRRMTTAGLRADISDGFASLFSDRSFNNDIGISIKQTWLHRGKVIFDNCSQEQTRLWSDEPEKTSTHKEQMNVRRAMIVAKLTQEITQKSKEFEDQLSKANLTEPLQKTYREEFYQSLNDESLDQFATLQFEALDETESYKQISTSWTSIWGYIPFTSQKFTIAPSFPADFSEKKVYPWEFNLRHSRIWESPKFGRTFFTVSAGAFGNNNIKTEDLEKISSKQNLIGTPGGPDTLNLGEIGSDEIYIGAYERFTTPYLKAQIVWFPPKCFAGIHISLEKNFGKYNPLDGKLGIPMRFKDNEGKPTINLELQLRSTDLTGLVNKEKKFREKSAIGISVGVPFSGFLY